MTPEEWPIWTPHDRGAHVPALRAGRDRLLTARSDFFLDEAFRLTEQERALMTAMLHRLVGDVAAEIQSRLPDDWLPANEDNEGLIERLTKATLLDIEDLLALLLRRADEERVAVACQARSPQRSRTLIQPLVSDPDAQVAAAAMAVLIARGRRRDRYGRPLVELDDVEPASARQFVFAVAAGLRERLPVHVSVSAAEIQLCEAALALLDEHDPPKSLDSALAQLVSRLLAAGRLDEAMLLTAIDGADIGFIAHALGARANLSSENAFNELMCCDARRAMALLRLADMSRGFAAQLLATVGDLIGLAADAHSLEPFDFASGEQLDAARSWLRLDPNFQAALRYLGHGNGHRSI